MFRCPACRKPLARSDAERSWLCSAAHRFDEAREGYVNLLITHQRRQREPGDSAEMVRHRRAFLDAGHFEPLRDAVRGMAEERLATTNRAAVLDAGCGEGYYTRDWPTLLDGLTLWAVDISKPAVRMAAKRRVDRGYYAVASVYDVPIVDASVDLAISVFAPLPASEFERVLRASGRLITVTPGPDHLAGLKEKLFAQPQQHPETGPFDRAGATTSLRRYDQIRLKYDLALDSPEAIANLVGMTPYGWYVGPDERAAVAAEPPLRTPVDFLLNAYTTTD